MHLMYYLDDKGKRVYTLKKIDPSGHPTKSAHPGAFYNFVKRAFKLHVYSKWQTSDSARFSPDDKYSRHRVTLKRRFGILPTQQPKPVY